MKIHYIKSFFIHLFILLIFTGCKKEKTEPSHLRSVILVSPINEGRNLTASYAGIIEEGKNVNSSFMTDGRILKLFAKEGDRVRKGQLLAELDDADYRIGYNQLKTQFDQMTEEKRRMDEMFNRHNLAPNDYEKFCAGYEQLRLQLEMMENKLGYTKLYSPTDGYIAEKFKETGELIGAGTPVYNIVDDSRLLACVNLPVSVYINKANIVEVSGASPIFPDLNIPLVMESFTPDPSNNMLYQMKLFIPAEYSKSFTPGMNLTLNIIQKESDKEGWNIPSRSVFENNDRTYVWIFNPSDSTLHKKEILIVNSSNGNSLTVTGLEGNENIVQTGVKQLYEGEKVHVVKNYDFGL